MGSNMYQYYCITVLKITMLQQVKVIARITPWPLDTSLHCHPYHSDSFPVSIHPDMPPVSSMALHAYSLFPSVVKSSPQLLGVKSRDSWTRGFEKIKTLLLHPHVPDSLVGSNSAPVEVSTQDRCIQECVCG